MKGVEDHVVFVCRNACPCVSDGDGQPAHFMLLIVAQISTGKADSYGTLIRKYERVGKEIANDLENTLITAGAMNDVGMGNLPGTERTGAIVFQLLRQNQDAV